MFFGPSADLRISSISGRPRPACSDQRGTRCDIAPLALLAFVLVLPLAALDLAAQSGPVTHDLVLAGGRVIDPANQLDGVRSVAISR